MKSNNDIPLKGKIVIEPCIIIEINDRDMVSYSYDYFCSSVNFLHFILLKIIHDLYIEKNITLKINKIYRVYSSYENSWDYYSFPLILTIKNNNIEILNGPFNHEIIELLVGYVEDNNISFGIDEIDIILFYMLLRNNEFNKI
ncbi:hypothetical protein U3516DRAFT_752878 [Neocallimastix sp. 'constans']